MILIPNVIKDALRSPIKAGVVAQVTVLSTDESYTSDNTLQSVVMQSTGYYYGVATRAATIKLLGTDYNLVDKKIHIEQNVMIDAVKGEWQKFSQGYFIVEDQQVDLEKHVTTIKAYDLMGKLAKIHYNQSDALTFPCTIENLVKQIAEHHDLVLETNLVDLPNANYEISEDLYEKIETMTYRDILAEIAGATATIALINAKGNLEFRLLARTTSDNLTYAEMLKFKTSPKYGEVNSVVLARTPQEDNIVFSDDESIKVNGLTEVKLANNEILDDDRQELIEPIFNASKGFWFFPSEITTTGHGYYEIGDRIAIHDSEGSNYETIITSISLTLDGGISEVIKGVAPTITQTNYALAGGITNALHNTEIKVDKQNQRIESIVFKQETFEGKVNENFTKVTQDITSVITSVQNSGGNNLLKNSAMYFRDTEGKPTYWELADNGTLEILPTAEVGNYGALSGQLIKLVGTKIIQQVSVMASEEGKTEQVYSFSCRVYKTAVGSAQIKLTDGINTWKKEFLIGEETIYQEVAFEGIRPEASILTLEVSASSDADLRVMDMMLSSGDYRSKWTQANGELANTDVKIDISGIEINSANTETSSHLTSQGLEIKRKGNTVTSITNVGVEANLGKFREEIMMSPIKIVPQRDGWAFVKSE